jgi:hypothetical protein
MSWEKDATVRESSRSSQSSQAPTFSSSSCFDRAVVGLFLRGCWSSHRAEFKGDWHSSHVPQVAGTSPQFTDLEG